MKKMIRSSVCVAAILCGLLASNTPALAADQSAEIRELQAQVKMLQERLDKMAAAPAVAAPAYQANPSAYAANAGTPLARHPLLAQRMLQLLPRRRPPRRSSRSAAS